MQPRDPRRPRDPSGLKRPAGPCGSNRRNGAAALARTPPLLSHARISQRVTGANAIPASAS